MAVSGNSTVVDKRSLRRWIQITMFAMLDDSGNAGPIRLREHQFLFKNMPKQDGLITGVYGTVSRNDALFIVGEYARSKGKTWIPIDLWYRIENIILTRNQIDHEIMATTGFLHLGGIAKTLRAEVQEAWIQWIAADSSSAQMPFVRGLPFMKLVTSYPQYAHKLFDLYPDLTLLVHPVQSLMDESGTQPLINVATMRADEGRIMHIAARSYREVPVEI